MIVIGIDPSLKRIGVSTGTTTFSITPGRKTGMDAVQYLAEQMAQTLRAERLWAERLMGEQILVAIEENIVGKAVHVQSMWLHGIIRHKCLNMGIQYVDIHPSRRAKWACGDTKERDKDAVLLRANKWVPEVKNNDEADATILRLMAEQAYGVGLGSTIEMTQYRRESLEPIMWPEVGDRVVHIPTKKELQERG